MCPVPEHAVVLFIRSFLDERRSLYQLEDALAAAIDEAGAGEFDGNEVGPDGAILYMYGPDADVLWETIESVVRAASVGPGSNVVKRYGEPGAREVRIDLHT